jgi:hypothetical protein
MPDPLLSCRTVAVMPAKQCLRHAGPDPASIGGGLRVNPPVKPGDKGHRSDGVMPSRCRHAGLDPASIASSLPFVQDCEAIRFVSEICR